MRVVLPIILFSFFLSIAPGLNAQNCSNSGNVVIFSNYDGGPLIIDIDENIPNLKIGIASYEPTAVTFTGAFVGNITEVIYAGFQPLLPGNDHCSGILTASVQSTPNATVQILNYPPVTLLSPIITYFGIQIEAGNNSGILGCYTCSNDEYQGGANTSAQIIDYFLTAFGGELKFLKTQYGCWCGVQNLDQPQSCCQVLNSAEPGVSITANPSLSFCDANVITLDAGPGYTSYEWNTGESGQTIFVSAPGTYTVEVTSSCGDATTQVTITPCTNELSVFLSDQTVCLNSEAVLQAVITGGTPPYSAAWSPNIGTGAGPFFVNPMPPFEAYTVTVTDADGITVSATATISIIEEEGFAGLGPDQDLCNQFVFLDATVPFEAEYFWSTGETGSTIVVAEAGTYSIFIEGQCGIYSDEIEILPCVGPLTVTLPNQQLCSGESATLTAFAQGGAGPYTYTWSPNVGNTGSVNVTPAITSTYTVAVTDAQGTQATATAIVTVLSENLTISLGPDLQLCTPSITLNASNSAALSYAWNTGATSASINVNAPGTYSVTLTGSCGTFTESVQIVECSELTVSLQNQSVCPNQSATIEAIVTGGQGPFQYIWSPNIGNGPGPYAVSPDATQNYTVTVIDSEGASAAALAIVSIIFESIEFDWEDSVGLCPGEGVLVSAEISSALSYLWSTGSTLPAITIFNPGVYTVQVSTQCLTLSRTVDVNSVPNAILPEHQTQFVNCIENGPLEIGWTLNEDYSLTWQNGIQDNAISVEDTGIYTALYDGACGIKEVKYSVTIEQCECDVFVPNAFTPNGDGLNEIFRPLINCETSAYFFAIYNRWGNKVFETSNPNEGWSGSFDSNQFYGSGGVYTYIIRIEPLFGQIVKKPIEKVGSVTMVR